MNDQPVKCYHCYDSGKWYSIEGTDRRVRWHECGACADKPVQK